MCGKSLTSSVTEEVDQNQQQGIVKMETDSTTTTAEGGNDSTTFNGFVKRKHNETIREKLKRRKLERKQRTLYKKQSKGILAPNPSSKVTRKAMQMFSQVWDTESAFVTQIMQCLPEVKQPGLLLDEEKRTDEYISVQRPRRGGEEDQDDEGQEKKLTQKFFAKVKNNLKKQGVEATAERATTYQELRERLHRRLAELAQKPNVQKREKKLKKKEARAKEAKSNKGKKLISQSAASSGPSVAEENSSMLSAEPEKKTPLKKKPVVKSNGEIVYSKFDFIAGSTDQFAEKVKKGPAKSSAEELLKQAEKHEKKMSMLETSGKKKEAVSLEENKKWEAALRRAEGQKVKDDPNLLKKTIKKMDKQKQVTKRKWKERVERVEKMKEQRQQKRKANIQSKKDDKKKKVKKVLRKRGRIA